MAATVAQAKELLTDNPIRLAIIDLKIPGASGIELCSALKEKSPDTVVLIIAGASDKICCCEAG
jgi:DNA-binding response OmpR family regulator